MSRTVRFVIEGDVNQGIKSLDSFLKKLDAIGSHKAIHTLQGAFSRARGDVAGLTANLRSLHSTLTRLTGAANQTAHGMNGMVRSTIRITNNTRHIHDNSVRIGSTWRRNQQVAERTTSTLGRMVGILAKASTLGLQGLRHASVGMRGAAIQGAGGIQSAAIGLRMSGIQLGQQFAAIGGGPLAGNFLSGFLGALRTAINTSVGIVTIGAELATRLITGFAGTAVKMAGAAVGALGQAILGSLGGLLAVGGKGVFKALGVGLFQVGAIVQNLSQTVTQLAGEVVIQLGNAFVGVAEIFRGAFQAGVNIASQLLNSLVNVASEVVGKIAGVLGGVAKGVLGTAGVLGGLALRDYVKGESAITSGLILFSPEVTAEQKKSLQDWVFNLAREVPNLDVGQLGKAFEMAVSTGFQSNPEGLKRFLSAGVKLASSAGVEDVGSLTRTMAKVFDIYKGEISAEAKASGEDPFAFLAGRIQQLRNVGDLDVGELSQSLGEVAGVAKAMGLSFDQMLVTLAELSRFLGREQTFTTFTQMNLAFTKLSEKGAALMSELGISTKELSVVDKARLADLQAQREALEAQVGSATDLREKLDGLKDRRKDMQFAGADKDDLRGIDRQIDLLTRSLRDAKQGSKDLKGELKALAEEEDRILRGAKSRNPLDVIKDVLGAGLSEDELAEIFNNVRAFRGVVGKRAQSPDVGADIRAGLSASATETLESGVAQRAETVGFKMASIFKEMKQPFITFIQTTEGPFLGFLDRAIGKLKDMNAWVKEALMDPGALAFVENLGGKFASLFDKIGISFQAISPKEFWAAMNGGLDKAWEIGGKVVGVFTTLGGVIADLVKASPLLQEIWAGMKDAGSAMGEGLGKMAEGDRSPLVGVWKDIKNGLEDIKQSALGALREILTVIGQGIEQLKGIASQILDTGGDVLGGGVGAGAAYLGATALMGGRGRGRGRGRAGLGGAGAAPSRGGRMMGGLKRAGGPLATAAMMAGGYALGSSDGPAADLGWSGLTIGGYAATGAALGGMFGPVGAALGAIAGTLGGIVSQFDNIANSVGRLFGGEDKAATSAAITQGRLSDLQGRIDRDVFLRGGSEVPIEAIKDPLERQRLRLQNKTNLLGEQAALNPVLEVAHQTALREMASLVAKQQRTREAPQVKAEVADLLKFIGTERGLLTGFKNEDDPNFAMAIGRIDAMTKSLKSAESLDEIKEIRKLVRDMLIATTHIADDPRKVASMDFARGYRKHLAGTAPPPLRGNEDYRGFMDEAFRQKHTLNDRQYGVVADEFARKGLMPPASWGQNLPDAFKYASPHKYPDNRIEGSAGGPVGPGQKGRFPSVIWDKQGERFIKDPNRGYVGDLKAFGPQFGLNMDAPMVGDRLPGGGRAIFGRTRGLTKADHEAGLSLNMGFERRRGMSETEIRLGQRQKQFTRQAGEAKEAGDSDGAAQLQKAADEAAAALKKARASEQKGVEANKKVLDAVKTTSAEKDAEYTSLMDAAVTTVADLKKQLKDVKAEMADLKKRLNDKVKQ